MTEYKPKFAKPGKRIKIDNPNSELWWRKAKSIFYEYFHKIETECRVDLDDCQGPIEIHRLIGLRNRVYTNHPENGFGLCSYHHKLSNECSPHGGPAGFSEFLLEIYPDKAAWIIENQHTIEKPDFRADYHRIKKLLEGL